MNKRVPTIQPTHNSSDDSLDGDIRANRAANAFYQNPEHQFHFRNIEEYEDPLELFPDLVNMSNPRGENFMAWAGGNLLPSYSSITELKALKTKKALPDSTSNDIE